jgi:hypothetical protein
MANNSPIIPRCSWCGALDPTHQGGITLRNGKEIRGNFCNRQEFDYWLRAHALIGISEGS